jgi:H+/Cl- antiporter ClcA
VREVLRELWVASRDLFRSLREGFLGRTPPPDWLEEAPRRMREVIPLPPSARLRGLELPLSVILLAFEVLAGLVRGIYLSVRYDLHNSSQRDSRSSRGYSLAVRALWLLFVLLLVGTIVAFVVLMLAGEEWTG